MYISVVPRLDNLSGDENPYLYSEQNNYIAHVKLGSSIEIAQEATSFSSLVVLSCVVLSWLYFLVYKSFLAIINASLHT